MAKAAAKGKKTFKKKERKNIPYGIVHISASFNNTLISITDTQGNLIAQSSSGARGFRHSKRLVKLLVRRPKRECVKQKFV
jgi:small subunit ribosomal protein S11